MPRQVLIAALAGCALLSCGSDTTTGRPVVLETRIVADLGPERTFTTGRGWRVTLTKAAVSTGPLYYFHGAPAFVRAPMRLHRLWMAVAPLSTAHAHPGHYAPGSALGQMLVPSSFDLLGTPAAYPAGTGVTGLVRSATFSFSAPPTGPAATLLGNQVAVAEGVASKGDASIHFSLGAERADVEKNATNALVTGCSFAEQDIATDGTVTVTIRPRVWLDFVDFSELAPGAAQAPTLAAANSTARLAFALGVTQLGAYHFSYTTP